MAADETNWSLFEQYFGKIGHTFCIRGNWTASFWGGNDYPLAYSENELTGICLTNNNVFSVMKTMGEHIVHSPELSEKLIPFSTKLSLLSKIP